MAWQAYMESSLLGTGAVDQVIIFEKSTGKSLAASMGFLVSEGELEEIINIFKSQPPRDSSFHVAGQTYSAVKIDARSLYGTQNTEGVCIVNTATITLLAHYSSPSSLEEAARCVEQLCDKLIDMGI